MPDDSILDKLIDADSKRIRSNAYVECNATLKELKNAATKDDNVKLQRTIEARQWELERLYKTQQQQKLIVFQEQLYQEVLEQEKKRCIEMLHELKSTEPITSYQEKMADKKKYNEDDLWVSLLKADVVQGSLQDDVINASTDLHTVRVIQDCIKEKQATDDKFGHLPPSKRKEEQEKYNMVVDVLFTIKLLSSKLKQSALRLEINECKKKLGEFEASCKKAGFSERKIDALVNQRRAEIENIQDPKKAKKMHQLMDKNIKEIERQSSALEKSSDLKAKMSQLRSSNGLTQPQPSDDVQEEEREQESSLRLK
ncbi:hypothetical protein GCM10007966_04500 [Legionella impletisoli]|uniref:Uncharacterized protein n=2 Tax=Legionella impletisoli TaxID=343510 RepID=A0A917JPS8_9GAMM|nr:hypothetical protein GCM10007966_04500 [Legionella impletisoli]